jgi:hypothetical protein
MSRNVRIKDLQPGDYVIDWSTAVENRYNDPEGLWIETSDGEVGYVDNTARKVEVMDY